MLKINNVELELDLYDADVMDKYTEALNKLNEKEKNKKTKGLSNGDIIRQECRFVFDFFNDLFGEGTDKKIFGNKTNYKQCVEALEQGIKYSANISKDLAKLLKVK